MKRQQVLPQVMADMVDRVSKGSEEYGEPLTTFNGRDALQDSYEEALDMALYLKQAIMERDAKASEPASKPWPSYGPSRESVAAVTSPESAAILADVPVIQGGWPGPDWSQAPEWAVAWAMDADGCTYWQVHIPGMAKTEWPGLWRSEHLSECRAPDFGYHGDWRNSLRKRPE